MLWRFATRVTCILRKRHCLFSKKRGLLLTVFITSEMVFNQKLNNEKSMRGSMFMLIRDTAVIWRSVILPIDELVLC